MNIDEEIIHQREMARLNRSEYESDCIFYGKEVVDKGKKPKCLKRAEKHEQIAEWLEELKVYQQHKIICNKGYNAGYNKAIDDFKEELFKNSERARPVGWLGYSEIVTCEKIYEIAEQLKAGGNDD